MSDLPGFLDFTKPGHGVVDDSYYHPFIRFWRRYGRHMMKLIQLNLVCAIATLPVFVWLTSLLNSIAAQESAGIVSLFGALLMSVVIDWPVWLLAALIIGAILIMGPVMAAMTYTALNCAWDRPGLFWEGFFGAFKENWKQALPIGILDAMVCFGSLYYFVDGTEIFGSLGVVVIVLWIVLLLLYCMIRVYLYPIMVTVELPLLPMLRNCLILSILKPWRALAVIAIAAALVLLCMVADIVIVPCFLYSFVAFSAAFLTQPVLDKYLLNPEQNDQTESE